MCKIEEWIRKVKVPVLGSAARAIEDSRLPVAPTEGVVRDGVVSVAA